MVCHIVLATVTTLEQTGHAKPDIMTGDAVMIVLTWVTFLGLLFVLQKFAWGPILNVLQTREKTIRDSLEKAEQIQKELSELESSKIKVLADARNEASLLMEESRKKAVDQARAIENQARSQAKDILEAAQEAVAGERERVRLSLRRESASIAVDLASKLLKANLDQEKSDKLVEQYIKELS